MLCCVIFDFKKAEVDIPIIFDWKRTTIPIVNFLTEFKEQNLEQWVMKFLKLKLGL